MSSFQLSEFSLQFGVIDSLSITGAAAKRLKSLGVFEGQRIELAHRGNPLIIKAAGSKVAIALPIAKRILVRDVQDDR